MLNIKNRVFNPYFSIGTGPMRKLLLWISRGLNLLSFSYKKVLFSLKLFSGHFYGQSFIKTVRGPLELLSQAKNLDFLIRRARKSSQNWEVAQLLVRKYMSCELFLKRKSLRVSEYISRHVISNNAAF